MHEYMKFIERFKRLIPKNIKPKFKNEKELLLWHKKQEKISSTYVMQNNKKTKIKKLLQKSGIKKLYTNCSFENYKIQHQGQKKAVLAAKNYAQKFNKNISSFIFSGKPGTGKNHLASAIGKYLIEQGKKVLIITVADLMSNIKNTFHNKSKITEAELLKKISEIDLLIIDEIGIQIESRYEKVILNQIIDRRSSSKKPTGMLSNLNYKRMQLLLGDRVIDRMRLGNSIWINFTWESFRRNITGHEK